MTETITKKLVTIRILDQSGDTTLEQEIDEAIKTAVTLKWTNGKVLNVRSEGGIKPFELHAKDINDTEGFKDDVKRFHSALDSYEKPAIFVTGKLAGGI